MKLHPEQVSVVTKLPTSFLQMGFLAPKGPPVPPPASALMGLACLLECNAAGEKQTRPWERSRQHAAAVLALIITYQWYNLAADMLTCSSSAAWFLNSQFPVKTAEKSGSLRRDITAPPRWPWQAFSAAPMRCALEVCH